MPHVKGFEKILILTLNSEILEKGRCITVMYAVIETGGKQYKVESGSVIYVEKLDCQEESTINFKVIMVGKEDGLVLGNPYLENAQVTGKVLKNGKGPKITVFTYKPKKSEKRKMGHRQPYTKVQIESITI